jgi:hypothetical protein
MYIAHAIYPCRLQFCYQTIKYATDHCRDNRQKRLVIDIWRLFAVFRRLEGSSAKRQKVAYLAALVERGELTCEEALSVSEQSSSSTTSAGLCMVHGCSTCVNFPFRNSPIRKGVVTILTSLVGKS